MRENYDFRQGKRGTVVKTAEERITIQLDSDIVRWFRSQIQRGGGNYQSLMNDALRQHIQQQEPLEVTLRRVIREENTPNGIIVFSPFHLISGKITGGRKKRAAHLPICRQINP